MDKIERIKELITELNTYSHHYYVLDKPLVSDKVYDKAFDELRNLEDETGFILSSSPTQKVQGDILASLTKVSHTEPMLSADKTKNPDELVEFLGSKIGVLSWKLDGLTIVLRYNKGRFIQAITRGRGDVGEDVTHTVKTFTNIPLKIKFKGYLELRGEGLIDLDEFERINKELEVKGEETYSHARNLASGSVRQLDASITKGRKLLFIAFGIVKCDKELKLKCEQFDFLTEEGFEVVDHVLTSDITIKEHVASFEAKISTLKYLTDGLIVEYDDIVYGKSLGATGHHTKNMIAFKWKDDSVETEYLYTECETGRTGIATPTAVFKTANIDSTEVSRASCHNIDVWEDLELGRGDRITVYKANMIIPQIDDNLDRTGTDKLPTHCASCGNEFQIYQPKEARFLRCVNPECPAQLINKLTHFVSRDCMNITGLSKETLEKFVDKGFLSDFADIYELEKFRNEIINMDGFGARSFEKMMNGINDSKLVELPNLITALGIKGVGLSTAKLIQKGMAGKKVMSATYNDLISIKGIGEETALSFVNYFKDEKNRNMVKRLVSHLNIITAKQNSSEQKLEGKTFCITGDVHIFKNRKEVQIKIEELGGKVSGSVSAKTDFLINNDKTSTSGKNKDAMKIQASGGKIQIISEEEFVSMIE